MPVGVDRINVQPTTAASGLGAGSFGSRQEGQRFLLTIDISVKQTLAGVKVGLRKKLPPWPKE